MTCETTPPPVANGHIHDSTTSADASFTPRPSTLAYAWLGTVGLSRRAQAVGEAIAKHASIVSEPTISRAEQRFRHLQPGDVAAWVGAKALADELGCCTLTVKRGIAELIDAGLDRRRTRRTNSYVFPAVHRVQPVPVGPRQPAGPAPRRPVPAAKPLPAAPKVPKPAVPARVPACDTPPVTLCVTPEEPCLDPGREPHPEPRENPSRASRAREDGLATDAQVRYAVSLGLETGVLTEDQVPEATARWSQCDTAAITLRIRRLKNRTEPRFEPAPPPVVPLDLAGMRPQPLPLEGDVAAEAEANAQAEAERIRQVLASPAARRLQADHVARLRGRLAELNRRASASRAEPSPSRRVPGRRRSRPPAGWAERMRTTLATGTSADDDRKRAG